MYKRKHRKSNRDQASARGTATSPDSYDAPVPDPYLYVQAHEADVIRAIQVLVSSNGDRIKVRAVPRLTLNSPTFRRYGSIAYNTRPDCPQKYDVRLLLDRLPDSRSGSVQVRPLSPSGWSDLPSDSEDTFFLSPDELEDYHRDKRRRLIERGREERLRAIATIEEEERDSDPWGGSDEEPDGAERELIRRTASHIASSPNPAQLEMRILANYGTDKRFAFLRGRWSRVWRTEKERAKQHQTEAKKIQSPTALASLGGLAGYGDSDGESADKSTGEPEDTADLQCTHEEAIKEARRARAKEWSARRRAQQSEPQSEQTRTMHHDDI